MTEKTFERLYPLTSPQGTFTRAANRMLNEYCATFMDEPDDVIKEHADAIKRCEETMYHDEYAGTYTSEAYDDRTYDTCKTSTQIEIAATLETDEYGDPVYRVYWYFYNCDVYEKRVGGKKVTATNLNTMTRRVFAAKGQYRYFCTHRPPSTGCIPDGFVSYETYRTGSRYIGEVTYDKKPAKYDLRNWGLVFDPDYEQLRNFILSEDFLQ